MVIMMKNPPAVPLQEDIISIQVETLDYSFFSARILDAKNSTISNESYDQWITGVASRTAGHCRTWPIKRQVAGSTAPTWASVE